MVGQTANYNGSFKMEPSSQGMTMGHHHHHNNNNHTNNHQQHHDHMSSHNSQDTKNMGANSKLGSKAFDF